MSAVVLARALKQHRPWVMGLVCLNACFVAFTAIPALAFDERWLGHDPFLETIVSFAVLALACTTSTLHVLTAIVVPLKIPDSQLDLWGKRASVAALVLVLYCTPWAVDELFG